MKLRYITLLYTAQKMSKYRVFPGPYFPLFSPNMGKYGSEKTLYLDTFHAVYWIKSLIFTSLIFTTLKRICVKSF